MANLKKGDGVRQIMPAPIVGTVAGFHADNESGELQALVEWMEGDEPKSRYFKTDQLEPVDPPAESPAE